MSKRNNDRREQIKELLERMFRGWIIYESEQELLGQETQEPTLLEEAMIRACEGDELEGHLLTLFSHWSNDVQSIAAHYGLAIGRKQPDGSILHEDGTIDTLLKGGKLVIVHIDPAPSPAHYWYKGAWQAPDPDAETLAVRHVPKVDD